MASIHFAEGAFPVHEGESVLECLERNGHVVPASCRSGVCQSCLVRATAGDVPERAQVGLRPQWKASGYFLACSCYPEADLSVCRTEDANGRVRVHIEQLNSLNDRTLAIRVAPEAPVAFRAGQFFNLDRGDGAIRSYSAASLPDVDSGITFHVALMPGGAMSGWFHNEARVGDTLEICGPLGTCCYLPEQRERPLLLAGTGTGLAPLYGIARDALRAGHEGEIHLVHGALAPSGLYLVEELRALAASHSQFEYHPCVLQGAGAANIIEGDLKEFLKERFPSLKGWCVYLCGDPALVRQLQRQSFLAGANMQDILADAFIPAAAPVKTGGVSS